MAENRHSVELRVVSESGAIERSIRLPRTARALLMAALATALAALVGAAAVAPSIFATVRGRREYALQQARRDQLGARLRALVEELARLDRQGERLARRVARYQAIYGLGPAEPPEPTVAPQAFEPEATIFAATIGRGAHLVEALTARLSWVDSVIASVTAWEAAHPAEPASLPMRWPLGAATAVPTSGFGPRRIPGGGALEFHAGLDIAAPEGTPVLAAAEGQVLWAGDAPADAGAAWWRLGKLVVIRHGDRFLTLYGHCDRTLVQRGRRVSAGDPVATVGATGWTASPQLHYEVRRRSPGGDWQALDPRLFVLVDESATAGPLEVAGQGPEPAPLPRQFRP
jgi:murein DD-endopeptidase MepM/ murein hydrolase activator NlpD